MLMYDRARRIICEVREPSVTGHKVWIHSTSRLDSYILAICVLVMLSVVAKIQSTICGDSLYTDGEPVVFNKLIWVRERR